MKATLSSLFALAALATLGGQAFAAVDAHEGYQRGFHGKRADAAPATGKAAFGTAVARVAFTGPLGGTRVLTTSGVQAWDQKYGGATAIAAVQGGSSEAADQGYRLLSGTVAR